MALELKDHMNSSFPPEGDEKPTANPDFESPDLVDDLEAEESKHLLDLISRAQNASTQEELDALMEEYLDGRAN